MPAFSGKYYYTLDGKGRIIIPAPFREIISTNYNSKLYVVNAAFDRCLQLFPQEEWVKFEEKVRQLPNMLEEVRLFKRRVIASAQEIEMDRQGRVLIPISQREDAGLKTDIVIAGTGEKIELWARAEWNTVIDITKIDRRAVEEKLASYGL